jgi:glycopeptide antibiotics resistance protein
VPFWCWWIPIVWIISFPWPLTSVPQWHRVHWVPFADPADKPTDLLANVLLFVPFGYSLAGRRRGRARILQALLAAGVVSISAEALQLFSTARYPSATDVSAAMAGAAAGGWARLRGEKVDG